LILIADENVQRTVVEGLRQTGHDVRHIQQMTPGVPDEAVLDMANRESAVLLTYDRDFGELVFRQKRVAKGVILVRPVGIPPARIADLAAAAISTHEA
jgi:predicted nuclease of predicted toxin-antitoxin system